ncbi:hypothetical protein XENOCAPTIV_019393 [Xenoophorus captivus]|uniref:Uncharacterized protein n=1 Tax=Xenoophorus captivus TaxID=1517983 RepID=A0ABV0RJR8_9TELE
MQAVRQCIQLILISPCMMGGGGFIQETAGLSTSAPLTLIRTALCWAKSHTDTNLCMLNMCMGDCLLGCAICTAKSDFCVFVCERERERERNRDYMHRAWRECCNINLLGMGSAVCWHVTLFHTDNVKYLSTGVRGTPLISRQDMYNT